MNPTNNAIKSALSRRCYQKRYEPLAIKRVFGADQEYKTIERMAQRGEIELIKKPDYWFVRHPDDQSRVEFDQRVERYRQLEIAFTGSSIYTLTHTQQPQ